MKVYLLCTDITAEYVGFVTTLQEAKNWVKKDPKNHYYWLVKPYKV